MTQTSPALVMLRHKFATHLRVDPPAEIEASTMEVNSVASNNEKRTPTRAYNQIAGKRFRSAKAAHRWFASTPGSMVYSKSRLQ